MPEHGLVGAPGQRGDGRGLAGLLWGLPGRRVLAAAPDVGQREIKQKNKIEQNNEDGLCSCKLSWCTFIWMRCASSFFHPYFLSMVHEAGVVYQISKYLLPTVPQHDASLLEGHDFEEAGA